MSETDGVLAEVRKERFKQDAKWGEQNHPDIWPDSPTGLREWYANRANDWKRDNDHRVECGSIAGTPTDRNAAWDGILLEEVYEALAETDPTKLRAELVQVAAVAVNWIEAIDRRSSQCDHDPDYIENDEVTGDEHARVCLKEVFCSFCDQWVRSLPWHSNIARVHNVDHDDSSSDHCAGSLTDENGAQVKRES